MKSKTIGLDEIIIGDRSRKNLGDITGLMRSIERVGVLHPPVVNSKMVVVAGERRLTALGELGIDDVMVTVAENLDDAVLALEAERDENLERLDLAPSEKVDLGRRLEELERPLAEERMRSGTAPGGKLPQGSPGKTRDKVGAAVGMSGRTYENAKDVVDAAERDPGTFGDVLRKMDASGNVNRAFKDVRKIGKRKAAVAVAEMSPAFPDSLVLEHGDFRDLMSEIPDGSVAMIWTDPPYGQDDLDVWDPLADQAARVLMPGGVPERSLMRRCREVRSSRQISP